MGSTELHVRWKDHPGTVTSVCKFLLEDNFLVDCTIAAEGQCLKAHRIILSACSPYFQLLFSQEREKHPIVFLKDTKFDELKSVIDFIYHGEVQISEDRLAAFLQIAESLQVKGLNDISGSNRSQMKVGRSSSDTSMNNVPTCFPSSSGRDHSDYQGGFLENTDHGISHIDQPQVSQENTFCILTQSGSTKSGQNNSAVPLEDCLNSNSAKNISSPSQRCLSEESSAYLDISVKNEPLETVVVEPKCETTDDTFQESGFEVSEDDSHTMEKEVFPESFQEVLTSQNQDMSSSYVESSPDNLLVMHTLPGTSTTQGRAPPAVPGAATWGRHVCSACGKHCFSPSALTIHLRSHTGARPFVCRVCGAAFSQSGHLTSHLRRHTGERPYKCDVCPAQFLQSNNLTRHKRLHTGERPYGCADCPKSFTTSCQLRTHRRRLHPEANVDTRAAPPIALLSTPFH